MKVELYTSKKSTTMFLSKREEVKFAMSVLKAAHDPKAQSQDPVCGFIAQHVSLAN